ncbi:MAG TPA: acyltransferase [Vicinamibacteria bacterium]|nr:acyltransferase [Vicinamibacteria bacterium]
MAVPEETRALAPPPGGLEALAPVPAWASGDPGLARIGRRVIEALGSAFEQWILCRGSKVRCLRRRGARIGSHATILTGVRAFGSEPWLIEIGSRVSLAAGVAFITHDGASRVFRHRIEGGCPFGNRFGTIRVLDNCVVGLRAILLPGVTIGPDSIVGAGSVVTRDVPPRTVAAGVPARVLCTLEEYAERYRATMIPGLPSDRGELRRALTRRLWGEER